jgi:hypothetical protein
MPNAHGPLRSSALRLGPLWPALLLALGCTAGPEGDDLPPGAFTSGGEDVVDPSDTDGTTSASDTTTTTTTSPPEDTGSSDGPPAMVSHAEHILPIWDANCTDSACHDADAPQNGLDLASDGVYERLCMQGHAFSGMSYIDCEGHDPMQSYVFRKLENTHLDGDISGASGAQMPPMPLSDDDLVLIEAWITGGTLP